MQHQATQVFDSSYTFFKFRIESYTPHTVNIFHPNTDRMPLVVPGINNTMPGGDQGDWLNKLAGKKITTEAVGGVDVSIF